MTTSPTIETHRDALDVITNTIRNRPRSLQKAPGPSQLGQPCTHCLTALLAGWEKTEDGLPWLPFIGESVHSQLERIFEALPGDRWLTEQTVTVGTVGGVEITGSCDLYDTQTGTVLDWKCVGATTLRTAKGKGPSTVYRRQAHLYGLGWENAGRAPQTVSIVFLPRNAISLEQGIWWHEPYQRSIAEQTISRADYLARQIAALAAFPDALAAWVAALDRDPDCRDCARYPDRPVGHVAPGRPDPRAAFADLLG